MFTSLLGSSLAPVLLSGQPVDGGGGIVSLLIPFVLVIAVFYFFLYRPQKKQQQDHEEMVNNLEKGDKIVTIGGIHGTIRRIDDDTVLAQVDSSSTKLRFDKQAIASVGGDSNN